MGHRRRVPGPLPRVVDAELGQQQPEPDRLAQRPHDHQAADDQGRRGGQGDDPARGRARRLAGRHRAVPARRRRQRRDRLAPVGRRVRRQRDDFVDISGVTIESPSAYAESALAFFNASGKLVELEDRDDRRHRPVQLRRRHDQLAAGRRGRHPARGHAREEPDHRRRALRRRARDRRRRHDHRALGHQGLRHDHRLAHRRPGHVHLRPARLDHGQRDHRPGDADRRRDRPRPGQPGRPRVQRDRLEPARRPDQHRHRRRARRPATTGAPAPRPARSRRARRWRRPPRR